MGVYARVRNPGENSSTLTNVIGRLLIAAMAVFSLSAFADEFLWLEEVEGVEALAWVEQQNDRSLPQLMSQPGYDALYQNALEVLNSNDRIPDISRRGDYLYNLWRDAGYVRGLYRRTTLDEFRKDSPQWETIIDLDQLARDEGQNWTWGGITCLPPLNQQCLISLSNAGSDAVMVREFDMASKTFVEGGFELPMGRSNVTWLDENTVLVGTVTQGSVATTSGYPAQLKRWQRGQNLTEIEPLVSASTESVGIYPRVLRDGQNTYAMAHESLTFYTAERVVVTDEGLVDLPIPDDSTIAGLFQHQLFVNLKSEWQGFAQGAVIYAPMTDLLAGRAEFQLFVQPNEQSAILDIQIAQTSILVSWLDNVRSRVDRYTPNGDGRWSSETVALDPNGTIALQNVSYAQDDFFVSYSNFLSPTTLYHVDNNLQLSQLKQLPAMFDATGLHTQQFMATSADGTQVPYFVVSRSGIELDGSHPTLLFAYGGFELSYLPTYNAVTGQNWLERGGVYVLANIRGGGEFGPRWHQAGLQKNRHKVFEDFEAVAEDLISRGITSPQHLGIRGGSNGGLLVGAAVTRRPDLYNAVVSQVPLLDMQRYNRLLAGASWMGEYGNPDQEDMWAYIRTYSPYHNVHAHIEYPKVFFTTSTRDDRVHPGHARKMVAKMLSQGHSVLYYENTEGGHSGAANNSQRAQLDALIYAYLWQQLAP